MNKELAISLHDVSMAYQVRQGLFSLREHWVLHDINFEIYRGETLAVIGRNGAGKSTLLQLLARISSPSKGRIETRSNFISLLSLNLGYMNRLSGRKNIVLSGMLYGLSKAHILELLPEIIEYSELGEHIEKPVGTYSAGMKARLGFATATVVNPDVLLVDEILGVGDISFREKSSASLRERLQSDKTAVLVSHTMHQVKNLCDRVVWVDQGRIRALGEPTEVIAQYEAAVAQGEQPG